MVITHRGLLVFLLALALAFGQSSSQEFLRWDVHVVNGLSSGNTLFLHCKSEDNDLGMHNLLVGAEFSWHFMPNVWGTTLYWCYMRKEKDVFAEFDVFLEQSNDLYNWFAQCCNYENCIWTAKDEGIYLRNIRKNNTDSLMYIWELGE